MLILPLFLSLFLSFLSTLSAHGFHEECRESLKNGKITVENVANAIADGEIARFMENLENAKSRGVQKKTENILHSASIQSHVSIKNLDDPPCPQPNATMFTTSTVAPPPTTQAASTAGKTSTGTVSAAPGSTESTGGTTAAPPPPPPSKNNRMFKNIYSIREEDGDLFTQHMSTLHYYMNRHDKVCDNTVTDLNSITEDQLYGYFSTLAASHPGPFCSLCHRFADEVHNRVLRPNKLLITDDDHHLSHLLYSHVPSPKTICSAIAPGCYENYATKVRNLTNSVICLECTTCMAVTNVIEHKILLKPDVVNGFYGFLRGNLFHNLCSELCWAFNGKNLTLFPNGFTYDGCQAVFKDKYYQIVQFATVLLRPERFCSLELQWCELNEQPNAVHCLRELCQEYFADTPQTRWLCSQIPDRPEQADAFLNIKQTKKQKEKKEYHLKFEETILHDEL